MEDDRDRLVVIIAGYSKEMKDFINANSGLKSRFVRFIEFADYSPKELLEIFKYNINAGGYQLEEEASSVLLEAFKNVSALKDRNFGNGRYVRNVYEEALKAQANRLVGLEGITEHDLLLISLEDIQKGLEKASTVIQSNA